MPELRDHYPEYHMFGVLPAYSMYVRHARGITLENVTFDTTDLDLRPALVCDDVENLELANFRATGNIEEELLNHPLLFRTPIVRNGSKATVGYAPDLWKGWT